MRRGDVRRAKLYYLRGRSGKAARIAEQRDAAPNWRARRPPKPARPPGSRGASRPTRRAAQGRARWYLWHRIGTKRHVSAEPRTLFDKIWDSHVVEHAADGTCLLYIDLHLVHEVTSPQAFEGLRCAGRKVRRPDATLAVADHNIPTDATAAAGIDERELALQVETLEQNCRRVRRALLPACATSARASSTSSGRSRASPSRA